MKNNKIIKKKLKSKSMIKMNPLWEKKGNVILMKDKYWKMLVKLQYGKD